MIEEHANGLLLNRTTMLGERNWRDDDTYKLVFSPKGHAIYQFPQQQLELSEGEAILLNPHDLHKQLHHSAEKWIVELRPGFVTELAQEIGKYKVDPMFALVTCKHSIIHQWFSTTSLYWSMATESEQAVWLENSLIQLALIIFRLVPGSYSDNWDISGYEPSVHIVQDALKQSFDHDWTLDEMVQLTQLGKFQFSHLFKQETGLSPYSWLQVYRVIKSQELLCRTDNSILSIAMQVGFKNVSSYHAIFRRIYGQTPGLFRKRIRNR
ncbi:AraC family transcriptional regulator [Terribacillus sp. 179-K 1B1 HS]|uniref:AraC family transcriptional regulator n=1 Tax=Terribacillus sp. 179-K 1B1 HS TaxID=3142388 RepID=UPI0039A03532